ncbi:hypothetical protein PoB_007209900 [Plakobranchus ocellatus]|uniref:Uncharacterized protein n=1 Tax=Plakobranchus ocellatus TaxID=259542 RepID=A0AAV4DN24_9GAST|nr:hypothetical protein PoB_007209900 [Plakobranchus ocellatus]
MRREKERRYKRRKRKKRKRRRVQQSLKALHVYLRVGVERWSRLHAQRLLLGRGFVPSRQAHVGPACRVKPHLLGQRGAGGKRSSEWRNRGEVKGKATGTRWAEEAPMQGIEKKTKRKHEMK